MSPMAAPPSSAPAPRVTTETVGKAVNALIKWRNSKSQDQKPQLLEEDDFIYLVLTLKKIPPKDRTNAHKIPLPHALHSATAASELCLIIDDRPRPSKLSSEAAKKKIQAEDVPITKVIRLSKLKTDYKPFEAKRKLCNSYDMFFADKRVIPLLPKLLGKQFFKKKKIPLPVDLTHKNWKEQIERALSSALLYLKTGTCSVLRVGKASMESEEIIENVVAAIDGVVEVVPKKWGGVRSFHLKFSESLALPIYQALPDMKLKIEGAKSFDKGEVEQESKNDVKLSGKKKSDSKKKGRIHEVRYMDEFGEDELGSEDDEEEIKAMKIEKEDLGGSDDGGKKKKKRGKADSSSAGKLNLKKKLKKSAVEEDEFGLEKKVKKGASKLKTKKSKSSKSA